MQNEAHLKKTFHSILLISVVFLIAYSPLASFLFALKNDMFIGYLPPRFLMGEAIHNNQLPLWNPYISFGLPFYGDMSSSYWSPITWLIASTTGYNPYTLTIEVLLYLLLSGLGMYFLSGYFSKNTYIRLIAAISYMCNGYIVGHLQHLNWLSGAAFMPWCLWALIKLHRERTLKSLLLSSVLFYLLISSSHPGIIIGSLYFFSAYVIAKFYSDFKHAGRTALFKNVKLHLLFTGLLLLLSAGLIVGYGDIIPYFDRNQVVDLSLSLNQNTGLKNWISFLLPFATTSGDNYFKNDPAFRNIYFGLIMFLLLLVSLFTKKSKQQIFFLVTGGLFLIISLGDSFKLFTAKFLPLLGYVRVNAEFRIFAVLCFIVATTIFMDRFITTKENYLKKLKLCLFALVGIMSALLIFSTINLISGGESVIHYTNKVNGSLFSRDNVKQLLDNISIYDTLFVQCIIQILLLVFLQRAFRNGQVKTMFMIATIDIILATLLNLPFTGVGKVPVSTISSIQKKSPAGIPAPTLQAVKDNDTIPVDEVKLIGDWSFYSKQPGAAKPALYPVKLINNYTYYYEAAKDTTLRITDMPFVYISNSIIEKKPKKTKDVEQGNVVSYKTGELIVKVIADTASYIVMLQNYYPHWYYKKDGKVLPVQQAGMNFIGVPLEKGEKDLTIFFNPIRIKAALFASGTVFIVLIILLFSPRINRFTFKSLFQ